VIRFATGSNALVTVLSARPSVVFEAYGVELVENLLSLTSIIASPPESTQSVPLTKRVVRAVLPVLSRTSCCSNDSAPGSIPP